MSSQALRHCSIARMGAWTLKCARAHELYNRWRGFQPWPGAFTMLDGKKLIVHRMAVADGSGFSGLIHRNRDRFTSRIIGSSQHAPARHGWN